ncbi:MAG TPA: zinc-ribbon domain-containing protein [Trebonia sp.]|nr:zinc-ribbon domain-containing protein [Trebonia sp.]
MTCTNCGQQLNPSDSFCDNCGTPVPAVAGGILLERSQPADTPAVAPRRESLQFPPPTAEPGYGQFPPPAAEPTFSQLSPPPPQRIASEPRFRLAQDETILKTYEAVQLRTMWFKRKRGQGTLYVTDARLVFYAWVYPRGTQRASWLLQQTKLEEISGLSVYVSRRISLGLLVLSIFFGLSTIGTLLTLLLPFAFIFAILTVICTVALVKDAAKRGSVGVDINTRDDGTSPISFGHGTRLGFIDTVMRVLMLPVMIFVHSYSAFDVVAGDPAEDADRLVHELGALILDLQTRGTLAYEHWGITEAAARTRAVDAL